MCFSPEASFAGGVIISAIGIATITKVHKPSQLVFASIPLFFGIQQIAEGFLWMTLPGNDYIITQKISTYTFLIMAQVIWPSLIPVSITLMEENNKRKKILWILSGTGLFLSLYYAFCLLTFSVNPEISGYHILYTNSFPKSLSNPAFAVYLFVTITPLFISGIKKNLADGYPYDTVVSCNCNIFQAVSHICMVLFCGSDKRCYLLDTSGFKKGIPHN
ncbi:MAG: hypothetical protein IPN67_21080 [Bacteroidales bacterium]|nr:hypothetical protein [Bacteroidales bacterium]